MSGKGKGRGHYDADGNWISDEPGGGMYDKNGESECARLQWRLSLLVFLLLLVDGRSY